MQAIVLLDVLTAKVKFGLHINGILPSFIPWNSIFHERGAQAVRRRQAAAGAGGYALAPGDTSADTMYDSGGVNSNGGSEDDLGGGRYALRLRGLRHPLLLGTYLKEKARLEKELRKAGVNVEGVFCVHTHTHIHTHTHTHTHTHDYPILRHYACACEYGAGGERQGECVCVYVRMCVCVCHRAGSGWRPSHCLTAQTEWVSC